MDKSINLKETPYNEIPNKEFTVKSFLNNPTGDAGTIATARKVVLEAYEKKLSNLIKTNSIKTEFLLVKDRLFFLLHIPSEKFDNFTYEVVIEFIDYKNNKLDLSSSRINFFSNSPSFAYSYAHVFNAFGIFIEDFRKKYSKEIFNEIPKIRNPDYTTFYEKSITFALLFIRQKDLFKVSEFQNQIRQIPLSKLVSSVQHLEDKVLLYKTRTSEESKRKKADKEANSIKKEKVIKKNLDTKKVSKGNKIDSSVNNKINNRVNNRVNNKAKMKIK